MSNTPFTLPIYTDTTSVMAGLQRLEGDLANLVNALGTARLHTDPQDLPAALEAMHDQCFNLGTELGAMRRAIITDLRANNPECLQQLAVPPFLRVEVQAEEVDPILAMYDMAKGLDHLGENLPEDQFGLAHLLKLLASEATYYCDMLNDAQTACKQTTPADAA